MPRYEKPSEWNEFEKHVQRGVKQESLFDDPFLIEPALYRITLNAQEKVDDKAVAHILTDFFLMNKEELKIAKIQLKKELKVECKDYTKDVAETKMIHVMDYIRSHQYPLKCSMIKN
jgi:ATP-dependent Clp protease adaptor protein ClpS